MGTQVIYPADKLSTWIADGLKRHRECLWA